MPMTMNLDNHPSIRHACDKLRDDFDVVNIAVTQNSPLD